MNGEEKRASEKMPLLAFPPNDRVFSGVYYGAYLTKNGNLYALGKTETEGILGVKDGKALIAENVVHAAVGGRSIAYVTRDAHLHVHGGALGRVFAEGPGFTGAKAVYSINLDTFLAVGTDGKNYLFGSNKDNIFQLDSSYSFQLNIPPANDPAILEVMRKRKDEFGKTSMKELFANTPSYQAWEQKVLNSQELKHLCQEYQTALPVTPATKYNKTDGSPEGIYAFIRVPNSFVIRPESGYLEGKELAPENVLDISSPMFDDNEIWKRINPALYRKAIYLSDEGRWLFLYKNILYLQENGKKTALGNDILDVDVSQLRVLILTTSGKLYQSAWRNLNGKVMEGVSFGSVEYPLSSFPEFRKRQGGGILGNLFNMAASKWEEIKWHP